MPKGRRTKQQAQDAWRVLKLFIAEGFEPFPLMHYQSVRESGAPGGKTPRDKGWSTNDYSHYDFTSWLEYGGNVGFRLLANQVVLDVDPRNNGPQSLEWLYWDSPEFRESVFRAPRTRSGRDDGGMHYYFSKDPDIRTRINLSSLPGLDFKRGVGLVVAPGSLHPTTGKPYTFDEKWSPISAREPLPESVMNLIKEPPKPVDPNAGNGGTITPQELRNLLAVLPAEDYGQGGKYHDEWLFIAMACHDGTNGDGEDEWLAWCAKDEQYGRDATAKNHLRWLSFEAGKRGRHHSVKTLFRAVSREGHKDLVASIGKWSDDFDDDPQDKWS